MDLSADEIRLKHVFKEAIVEALEENPDLLRNLFEQALEDLSMVKAIQEGEATELVDRAQIFEVLGAEQ